MYAYTENEYADLLRLALDSRRPVFYAEAAVEESAVLWRHDVDFSPQRALALARLEAEIGMKATYFFQLRGLWYNPLEPGMERLMQEIAGMGHALGLHFDPLPYAGKDAQSLETVLGLERRMLEHCAQCPVEVFSFHNPTLIRNLPQDMENWGGMVNAGARSIAKLYRYVSDSRGGWRRTDVPALLQTGGEPRLHILIHPFRWTPQIMTPRETLLRCVEGRAAAGRALAEKTIAAWGTGEVDESRDHLLSAWVGTASPS